MRKKALQAFGAVVAAGAAALALSSCELNLGTANPAATPRPTAQTVVIKAKYMTHMGMGQYAFNELAYKKLKNGDLNQGSSNYKAHMAAATAAITFAGQQAGAAAQQAQKTGSGPLKSLAQPTKQLSTNLHNESTKLMHQTQSEYTQSINSLYSEFNNVVSQAKAAGINIQEIQAKVPSS